MLIYCDKCKHEFEFESINTKSEWIDKDIEKQYFNCPKCGYEFIVVITNPEIRKLSKEYASLRDKYNESTKDETVSCEDNRLTLSKMISKLAKMNRKASNLKIRYGYED